MASIAVRREQTDFIIEEFAKFWGYLGQCGIMAKEMVLEGETNSSMEEDIVLKRAQLNRILSVGESIADIETKGMKLGAMNCNFYNLGFCSKVSIQFYMP